MSETGDEASNGKPQSPIIKRPGTAPSGEKRGGILRTNSESSGLLSPDNAQSPGFPHSLSYPNIKFAPLPELAPRKRHSSVSLGVASRSSLLRASRARNGVVFPSDGAEGQPSPDGTTDPNSPSTPPESSATVTRKQSSRKRKEGKDAATRQRTNSDPTRDPSSKREEDIAMDELAKLVKGAGKKLFSWKKGGSKIKGEPEGTTKQPQLEDVIDILADKSPCPHPLEGDLAPDDGVRDGLTVMEFLGTAEGAIKLDDGSQNPRYTVLDPSELPDFPGLSTSTTPIISIDRSSSSSGESQSQEGYGEIGESRRRSRTISQAEVAV